MNDELENASSVQFENERQRRFKEASKYLLEKNKELYKRFALYDTYGAGYKETLAYHDSKSKLTAESLHITRHLERIMEEDDELLKRLA